MDKLLHYTKYENLCKMFKGDCLSTGEPCLTFWASSAYCMDDQTEMNFGYPFIQSVLHGFEDKIKLTNEQRLSDIITEASHFVTGPSDKMFLPESRTPFVISFSRAIDNNYMWEHYGDEGRGVCIVFDDVLLEKYAHINADTFLFDIAYLSESIDKEIWESLANVIVGESKKCQMLTPLLKYKSDVPRYKKAILELLCPVISAAIKIADFSKEQEVRFISVKDGKKALSRNVNGKTKKYVEVIIPISCIKGLKCGPKFDKTQELEMFCKNLLKNEIYYD